MTYIIIIRIEGETDGFEFDSIENRQAFIDELNDSVDYVISDVED